VARRPGTSINPACTEEEVTVTQEQAYYPPAEEDSQHQCPDPSGPFTRYLIDVAVAKKKSDLYAEDLTLVQPRYDKLKNAQTLYAEAKKAQANAFHELKQRVERIRENLHCALDEAKRKELYECWKELLDDTRPPYETVDCRPIDRQNPHDLPKDMQALTDLLDTALKCRNRADKKFDKLIKLPEDLATTITDLAARATQLEQAVCTAPKEDLRRHYVEYLELRKDFEALEHNWIDATEYGCKLKRYFRALLRRHRLIIAINVAIERINQYIAKEEAEKAEKKSHLIDFVLACATSGSGKPGGYAESEQQQLSEQQQSEQPQSAQQSTPAPSRAEQQPAPDEEV
jgi:hypothetical protein